MLKATKDAVLRFQTAFEECQKPLGGGRTSLEVDKIKELVRSAPEAAHDFVLLQCAYATVQPAALQSAFIVAMILKLELADGTLINEVQRVAERLGATDTLKRVQMLGL